jgi:hypothetical protein
MLVVQVERFSRVAATVLYLFQNFFSWVLKCVKILLSEPTDQVPAANRFCLFPFYYSLHAQVVSQTLCH